MSERDPISERQRTVSRKDLKMKDSASLDEVADVSDELLEQLD
jgi:hypothetical protein